MTETSALLCTLSIEIPVQMAEQIGAQSKEPPAAKSSETFSSSITTTAKCDSFLLSVPGCFSSYNSQTKIKFIFIF